MRVAGKSPELKLEFLLASWNGGWGKVAKEALQRRSNQSLLSRSLQLAPQVAQNLAGTWALPCTFLLTLTTEAGRENRADMSKKDRQGAGPYGAQVSFWLRLLMSPFIFPQQTSTPIHSAAWGLATLGLPSILPLLFPSSAALPSS